MLWGSALTARGRRVGDDRSQVTAQDVVDGHPLLEVLHEGHERVDHGLVTDPGLAQGLQRGEPVADAAGARLPDAWESAAGVAEQAARDTAQLRRRVGRARPLAERSLGTPDAGAISLALCLRTMAGVLPSTGRRTRARGD